MENFGNYMNGPDQVILEGSGICVSSLNGSVKIRNEEDLEPELREPLLSVPSLFKSRAEEFPDHQALMVKRDGVWVEWTYKQYYDEARTVAKAFISLGLERNCSVGILGYNSPEWFIAQMGAIFAGGISAGIYTTNSSDACRYVVDDCKANILVVEDEKQLEKIMKFKSETPCLKAIVQYSGEPKVSGVISWKSLLEIGREESDDLLNDRLKRIAVNQCCLLIYTSGTTGPPKGVMLSHDNVMWTARRTVKYLGADHEDVFLSYLPLSHSAAQILDVWIPLVAAATVCFADKDALKGSFVDNLKEVRPTFLVSVPRVFEKIQEKMLEIGKSASLLGRVIAAWAKKTGLQHNLKVVEGNDCDCWSFWLAKKLVFDRVKQNLGLDRIRQIGIGAAPLSRETLEYFLSLDVLLSECFGMSETTGTHTGNREGSHRLGSVGPCIIGFKAKILDPDPEGHGEICFNSRNVMMGYLNKPKETKDAIDNDGWLHSGDTGFEKDGFITITGRIKDLIITAGGENIPPILIEDTIKECLPCVSYAFVIGDKRKFLSCLLTLRVEIDKDTLEPKSELTSAAREWCLKSGIKGTTVDDVLTGPDKDSFAKAIQDGIDRYNQVATSNAQKIQKFVVLPTDFSLPGGELGPTMKVKRQYVLQKYESVISTMYVT